MSITTQNKENIAICLKLLRMVSGKSISDMIKESGLQRRTIEVIESEATIRVDSLILYLRVLGVELEDIIRKILKEKLKDDPGNVLTDEFYLLVDILQEDCEND